MTLLCSIPDIDSFFTSMPATLKLSTTFLTSEKLLLSKITLSLIPLLLASMS
ncbi:MAG: hypothetical protein SFT91_05695 [Rickettsiaceae bacterium]|nr:hypothetical protein [Rickettsiaceae bacterium]